MKYLFNTICTCVVVLYCAGCSVPNISIGRLTAVATDKVAGLETSTNDGTSAVVEGESCQKSLRDRHTHVRNHDERIEQAVANAIESGREQGIDGDILVNAEVIEFLKKTETKSLDQYASPNIVREHCIKVKGTLVKLK